MEETKSIRCGTKATRMYGVIHLKTNKMSYCPDCGCKVYSNGCVNCHEENYIADQYYELDMEMPEHFRRICDEKRQDFKSKKRQGYYKILLNN